MDVDAFLKRLTASRHYRGQIAAHRVLPARAPQHRDPHTPLPPTLRAVLAAEGVERLYAHQADAFDAICAGQDIVICTGAASGKSLCYQLPVIAALAADANARALYLSPAKALAYDQLATLQRLVQHADLGALVRPECFDGDTPQHKRPAIRRRANLILSNPDMLHVSILPHNAKWAGFLAQLRFVLLDEVHTYRGIFGSHVAGVMRRLLRLCAHYGARPQLVCCSATLGNPLDLAQRLSGRAMRLIDNDGSPRGRKWFVLWNPPWQTPDERGAAAGERGANAAPASSAPALARAAASAARGAAPPGRANDPLDPASTALVHSHPTPAAALPSAQVSRRSGNAEAQALMQALLEDGAGTITFCKARVVAELIYTYVVDALKRKRPDLARRVRPYRGGYLPNERRAIEDKLFCGELLGVCSTSALELGIDVGSLDAAILVGFPGTLCSLWQQAGRAGRRRDDALVIYVAYDDPVDQYLMRNPGFLFERPLEHAVIDPDNPHILAAQLACASHELALSADDLTAFGPLAAQTADRLAAAELLKRSEGKLYWSKAEFPAAKTSLRTISNATFAIVDATAARNEVIGQVDAISAPELIYPEAVYLH